MKLTALRPHKKYGSDIFTKPTIKIVSTEITEVNVIEVMTINFGKFTVTSLYKPPNIPLELHKPKNVHA